MAIEWPEHCRDLHLPSQLTLAFRLDARGVRMVEGEARGDLAARLKEMA